MMKLVPGYDLDMAIDREIFGRVFTPETQVLRWLSRNKTLNRWKSKMSPEYWIMVSEYDHVYAKQEKGKYLYRFDVQKYSRDIEAAFRLVKFMRKDFFGFKMAQLGDDQVLVSFICQMGPCAHHGTKTRNHHGAYDVEEKSIPLAICKAALIAKKVIPCLE